MDITPSQIAATTRTANIELLSDEITVFVNAYGQRTPILVVGRCRCDGIEYGALFHTGLNQSDPDRGKCYVVELVRVNGEIKEFRDLDGVLDDEAFGVIANFFLDNNIYERNRIYKWIFNTRISGDLSGRIPTTMLERWEKKRRKRRRR